MLAIPRGAVPMGKMVADALDGELDVVLVRKLRAPQNPELVIGSIVLDDGIATGSTMIAALRAVRARHPAKLIAATGVASAGTLRLIRREADEVVCLETPEFLDAIGYHFRDLSQVSDEEVVASRP